MNNLPFRKRNPPQEKKKKKRLERFWVFFPFSTKFSVHSFRGRIEKNNKEKVLHRVRFFSLFSRQIFLYSPKDAGEMQPLLCNKNIQDANKPNSLASVKSN